MKNKYSKKTLDFNTNSIVDFFESLRYQSSKILIITYSFFMILGSIIVEFAGARQLVQETNGNLLLLSIVLGAIILYTLIVNKLSNNNELIKSIWHWSNTHIITIIVAFALLFVFLYYEKGLIGSSFSFICKIKKSTLGIILLILLWVIILFVMIYQTIQSFKHNTLSNGRTVFVSTILTIIIFQCLPYFWETHPSIYLRIVAYFTIFLFIISTLYAPLFLYSFSIMKSRKSTKDSLSGWSKNYLNDTAIAKKKDDELHFEPHLNKLLDILNNIPNEGTHSIAITGGWGKGKTSFLNLLKLELCKTNRYEVIWFDPMKSSNPDNIQSDFFDVMETSLAKYKQDFGRSLKYYKELIGAIDNKYVSFLLQLYNIQLEDEKKRIENTIKHIPKKIVIIIDDVDRLSEKEIPQIFRLVRFNAKFNKVVFLLALDKKNVIKTLECDEKYPDKFFELEFPLPDNGKNTIADFIINNEQLKGLKLSFFDQSEITDFTNHCIDTLRDAKRFLNFFINRVGIINGVLDLRSYYILSLIQYKYPTLYERIHNKETLLYDKQPIILKDDKDIFTTSNNQTDKEESTFIKKMLLELFPEPSSCQQSSERPINQHTSFEDYFTETSTKIVSTTQMLSLLFKSNDEPMKNALSKYQDDKITNASMVCFWKDLLNKNDMYPFLSNNVDYDLQQKIEKDDEIIHRVINNYYKILKILKIEDGLKYSEEGLAPCKYNMKWGYINRDFKLTIPFIFDEASPFSESFACVKRYGKYKFIDKNKFVFKNRKFNGAYPFSEGLACVKKNKKWGFIDKKGNIVIPLEYDDAGSFSEGLAYVKKDGKWGFVDKEGNIVIPLIYDDADSFSHGLARIRKDDRYGHIDKTRSFTPDQ